MLRLLTLGGLAVVHSERPVGGAAAQPRRLALLAVLARAGDRGVTRDRLLALFWPDDEPDRARRTLAQALYALRRDLGGEGAIAGTHEVRLDGARVGSDVGDFVGHLRAGRPAEAAAVYQGAFLAGFQLPGVPAFERWMEEERAALARDYARALERLALAAEREGDRAQAVHWWRDLATHDPLDARVALRLMSALEELGDRAGALRHARVYEALVHQELDLPPDREVVALAERLRAAPLPVRAPVLAPGAGEDGRTPATPDDAGGRRAAANGAAANGAAAVGAAPRGAASVGAALAAAAATSEAPAATLAPSPAVAPGAGATGPALTLPLPEPRAAPPDAPAPPAADLRRRPGAAPRPTPARRTRRPAWWVLAGAVAATGALAAARWSRSGGAAGAATGDAPPSTVAVGLIADFRGEDRGPAASARPLADMLATNLARAEGVRVVSPARVYELLHQLGESHTAPGGFVAAARQAGAGELVEGTLYERPGGALRLDLRRVDIASGAVRAAFTIEGRDLFALADSGTARLLAAMGAAGVRGSIADVTTRSEGAYQDYTLGLRAYVAGLPDSARALLDAALRQDSAFAMAAYYQAMTFADRADRAVGLARAARLAERASERERLLIRTRWMNYMAMAALRPTADSLVARYPAEVEGHYYAGVARSLLADYAGARAPLERAIAMDSLSLRAAAPGAGAGTGCTACSALRELAVTYMAADDGDGAVRTARRWTRLQPRSGYAWAELGEQLDMRGRWDEARAAYDSALAREPKAGGGVWMLVRHAIRRGRLDEAERLARGRLDVGGAPDRSAALWMYIYTLRHQGRAREAEVAARQFRVLLDSIAGGRATAGESFLLGFTLGESGRPREAAAVFDSLVRGTLRPGEDERSLARHRPNALVELARARRASGDTASLPRLADSTEAAGATHSWRLQQLMHHEVRAMLYAARGDRERAIAEWRAAISSPTRYSLRAALPAGLLLTAAGRPREAVALLQPTLRGWIDGPETHTEAHEALAEAWAAIPGPAARDSAAAHWRYVAEAWRHGDPPYAARAARARQRLAGADGG